MWRACVEKLFVATTFLWGRSFLPRRRSPFAKAQLRARELFHICVTAKRGNVFLLH